MIAHHFRRNLFSKKVIFTQMTEEREEYLADARILALLTGCPNETLLNIEHLPTVFRPGNFL